MQIAIMPANGPSHLYRNLNVRNLPSLPIGSFSLGGALRECDSKGKWREGWWQKHGGPRSWIGSLCVLGLWGVKEGMVCSSFVSSVSSPGPPEDTQLTGVRIGESGQHLPTTSLKMTSHSVIGAVSGGFVLWCWDGAQSPPLARLMHELLPSPLFFFLNCIVLFYFETYFLWVDQTDFELLPRPPE